MSESGIRVAPGPDDVGDFEVILRAADGLGGVAFQSFYVRVIGAGFTITAGAGEGGTISPSGAINVPEGGSQTFAITASDGFHVKDVVVDGTSVGGQTSYTFRNVTDDHTIAASFEAEAAPTGYTVTAIAGAGGAISPSGAVSVALGGTETFAIAPASAYRIKDVRVDGGSVGPVESHTFANVSADHTIEAVFERLPDAVRLLEVAKVGSTAGSLVSEPAGISCGAGCAGTSATFADGARVVVTATELPGATFLGWRADSACDVVEGNRCEVVLDADKKVSAGFEGVVPAALLRDEFSGDLSKWTIFGSPSPSIAQAAGPDGATTGVFATNDDGSWGGFALSKQTFRYAGAPLEVTADVKQLGFAGPDQHKSSLFLNKTNQVDATKSGGGYQLFVGAELFGNSNGPSLAYHVETEGGTIESGRVPVADGNGWHRLGFAIGADGLVRFYVDGGLVHTSQGRVNPAYDGQAAVFLGHRRCYIDNVAVTSGTSLDQGDDNEPPVLSVAPTASVAEGGQLTLTLTATDPDDTDLIFSVSGAPADATLTDHRNGTATFAWTPPAGSAGEHVVTFGVTDYELRAEKVVRITVTGPVPNYPPILIGGAEAPSPVVVVPGAPAVLRPSGGSGSFSASVKAAPAGAGLAAIEPGADGTFRFRPSGEGAFAGAYEVEFRDAASGLTKTVTLNVPLTVEVSARNFLETDPTQTVTVRGGQPGDSITFMVKDAVGVDDTAGAIASVAPATAASDPTQGNPAVGAGAPADVSAYTPFTVEAADTTQPTLTPVATPRLTVVPEQAYSGQVVAQGGGALNGAWVAVVGLARPGGGAYAVTTGSEGRFRLAIPQPPGPHPELVASAPGYVTRIVSAEGYAGNAGTSALALLPSQGRIAGALLGLAAGHGARVFAACGGAVVGPVAVTGNGGYELSAASRTVCSRVWAAAEGYENAVADNGGLGFDLRAGDALGVDLALTSVAVTREGVAEGALGGVAALDPARLGGGGTVVFGDGTAAGERTASVQIEPDGLDLGGAPVTSAELRVQAPGAGPVEVVLALTGAGGEVLPTRGAGSVVRQLRLTIPFDPSRVPAGAIEGGTWQVYSADDLAGYQARRRRPLAAAAVAAVDYLRGLVTFDTSHLSAFGVEPVAPAPEYYAWAAPGAAAMGLAGGVKLAGAVPPAGTEVGVFDSRGGLVGAAAVDEEGGYTLNVEGEGLAAGEALALKVYVPGRGQAGGEAALSLSAAAGAGGTPLPPAFEATASHQVNVDVLLVPHQADYNPADLKIGLSELLRVIQLYNTGSYGCDPKSEDGFAPGGGNQTGTPHTADYNGQDWKIGLSELLRVIQLYNTGGYRVCGAAGEDGFCPGW
ncbi:MAG: InlB B-repeat-containing protein [Deferrisomatales bacterium]